ncbi:hypothetical protein [Streptomyces sp. AK02-01A]|uniref:hypothetical protein n=1 Tax=Streptomyces sp. AK02-01A TaxID=3028648 RepID=UPI0029A81B36|nr:hypothetical protein [Streptomyces sp. AK02-01A]MDX3853631.1 hypothetical protein [Streptomyces sp. AK02-01A]
MTAHARFAEEAGSGPDLIFAGEPWQGTADKDLLDAMLPPPLPGIVDAAFAALQN